MNNFVRVLTLLFSTPVSPMEIPWFRGAVIKQTGLNADILFHNHKENSFRYSYPLIQYKTLGGKAAIVALNEGADIIGQFVSNISGKIRIGEREEEITIERIMPVKYNVQTWSRMIDYHLYRWLPLNSKNYHAYISETDEILRKQMLEKILTGNLLSLLKGLGIHIDQHIEVKINNQSESFVSHYKDVKLMTFNLDFSSNLSIPNNLGIGKNSSIGFGNVRQIKYNESN